MNTSATPLPWYLNAANQFDASLRRIGIKTLNLDLQPLIDKAQQQTGLKQFTNYHYETALRQLLNAYEQEADLSLLGRVAVRSSTLLGLTTQLEIQQQLLQFPEILDTPIEKPLFILGFPRTGTTLLHNLLAQGINARSPTLWELERPSPAIGPDTPDTDPRKKITADTLAQTYKLVPHLQAVHAFNATMPEECVVLLRKIFSCGSYAIDAHVPSYLDWFDNTDRVAIYTELKKMLQLLMWKYPGYYPVLKSPLHLYSVDAILKVFPDARIIQTHRDPYTVAGSGCSLAEVLRRLYSINPDPKVIGQDWIRLWGTAMNNCVEVRTQLNPKQFFDVHYKQVVSEPVQVVEKIYQHFDMNWDAGMASRCNNWIAKNPSQKHGKHSYDAAYYGISQELIKQHFASYFAQYDFT